MESCASKWCLFKFSLTTVNSTLLFKKPSSASFFCFFNAAISLRRSSFSLKNDSKQIKQSFRVSKYKKGWSLVMLISRQSGQSGPMRSKSLKMCCKTDRFNFYQMTIFSTFWPHRPGPTPIRGWSFGRPINITSCLILKMGTFGLLKHAHNSFIFYILFIDFL